MGAGDVNPPAGPVGGTMKTLSEVELRIGINATNTPGDADSLYRITAPASAAILGSSAPDSTGSTHPNANFTY